MKDCPSPSIAKTPRQAYERYADQLKQVLSCITDTHFVSNVHPHPDSPFAFAFTHNPARLNRSAYCLYLIQRIRLVRDDRQSGTWKVKTLSYEYNVERWEDHQEIVCFHWEGEDGRNPDPHIHVGFAALQNSRPMPIGPKSHIPSGRVVIEDIVKFAIEELGVDPISHRRTTWRSIIKSTRKLFMKFKTW